MKLKHQLTALTLCAATVISLSGCSLPGQPRLSECEKNGHDWDRATCTEPKTCSVCGETKGDPAGHDYLEAVITEAACDTVGKKSFTCQNSGCDDTYTEEFNLEKFDGAGVHNAIKGSICEITVYDNKDKALSLGSGFVYEADGKIVTNYHVIEDSYSIKVNLGGTDYDVDYILAYDKDVDLAVLKIGADGLSPLKLCEKDHEVGKAVYAMGSSKGMTNTFSTGTITNDIYEESGVEYVQHDAAISSGNSGGPLVNEFCEVIGVNTLTLKDSQNMNFAVSVREIKDLDFSNRMTPAKFYETESNPFDRLADHIIDHGEFDPEYNTYEWDLGDSYSGELLVNYEYSYDTDDNTIDMTIVVINDETFSVAWITMEDAEGYYEWSFIDENINTASGPLNAGTFHEDAYLSYTSSNISYSTLRTSCINLTRTMLNLLMTKADGFLAPVGLEAEDFGFTNY